MLDRASRVEPRQHGRGVVGHKVSADFRAAGADLAGAVEHVLVRERHAVQRTERAPSLDGRDRPRGLACALASAVTLMKQLSTGCRRSTRSRQASTKASALSLPCAMAAAASRNVSAVRIRHAPAPRAILFEQAVIGFDGVVERRPQQDARGGVNPFKRAGDRSDFLLAYCNTATCNKLGKRRLADVVVTRRAHSTISAAKDCTQI